MENTGKSVTFKFSKNKVLYGCGLVVAAFVICRGPLIEDSFVTGIAFVAYMMSIDTMNLYLMLPAAAGMMTYISRGYDPWGYMIAMAVCGLVLAASRRIKPSVFHRAVIAAACTIVAGSIYRFATGTVYVRSPEELIKEAGLVFALVYVFAGFHESMRSGPDEFRKSMRSGPDEKMKVEEYGKLRPLYLTSLTVIYVLVFNGAGISFMIWMALVFLVLWALVCLDVGDAMVIGAVGGCAAALAGQSQWGMMATLMIGIVAASFAKGQGAVLQTVFFAAVCRLAAGVESGVILGMDSFCILLPSAAFLAAYWKAGNSMKRIIQSLAGKGCEEEYRLSERADTLLKERAMQLKDLSELYATYIDSRSMFADQFRMMIQMIEDLRWKMSELAENSSAKEKEKFQVEIAISQYAACGEINGDCCGWQEIGEGRLVMIVSDGMGKGKKAAVESLMVTKTVMRLLKAGVSVELALKTINTIMLMKEDEDSYATLDMIIVDKQTGKAGFYKIGAAPTLIRRKAEVEEVRVSAVPLGIVNGLKVRYVETALKKDDRIIMMSDGVSDGGRRNETPGKTDRGFIEEIKKAAADVRSADPQIMSDLIMNRAADSYFGRERDDLTVMVARIL